MFRQEGFPANQGAITMKRWFLVVAPAALALSLAGAAPARAGLFTFGPADYAYGPYTGGHGYSYAVAYGYALPFSSADTFRPYWFPWDSSYFPPRSAAFFAPSAYPWGRRQLQAHPVDTAPPLPLVPVPSGPDQQVVVIEVQVPADAELWFDDEKTNQTGPVRTFSTPPLPGGNEYHYAVRARWAENGRAVEQVQMVTVHGGQRVRASFPIR
jgi:uncharacterized protein (TIGR03000 family)